MEDNNYNNDHGWRQRLADLQHAGDSSFSQEPTWSKLHQRLQHKKVQTKVIWYWMAAACLLIVMISFLFVHKKENVLVKTDSKLRNNTITKSIPAEIPNQNNTKSPSVVVNTPKINFIKKKATNKISDKKTFRSFNIQHDEVAVNNEIKNNTAIHADTLTAFIAKPAIAKNKLKVVHLNELGEPNDPDGIERNKEYASSVLRFMNRYEYQIPRSPVKTGIKIFSNN